MDGQSAKSSVELQLGGTRGHYLIVSQHGDQVLVLDSQTGKLMRINVAGLTLGATADFPVGSQVVASLAATYIVNDTTGYVQRIEPVTLAPMGRSWHVPGRLGDTAVVDDTGTLWMPVLSNGTVIPVTSAGPGPAVPVGSGSGLVLTSAAGVPIAIDRTTRTMTTLGPSGAQRVVTLPAAAVSGGWQAMLVPAVSQPGSLPVVGGGATPSLAIVDLNAGTTQVIQLGSEVSGHRLGQPVQTSHEVFVPDYTTGGVLVYDTSAKALAATIPVTGHAGTFEAEVIDGIAYFNDPAGSNAVVVTPDGQVHVVAKSGPGVPTSKRSQPPGNAPASPPPHQPSPDSSQPPATPPVQGSTGASSDPTRPAGGTGPPGHSAAPTETPTATGPGPTAPATEPAPTLPPTPTQSVAPPLPPTAPQQLSAQVSQHQVQLSWSPPASSGGGAVSYTVGWGSGSAHTAGTSYTITGLSNFQTYPVTVTASTPAGQSQPVAQSVSVSPGTTWHYNVSSWVTLPLNIRTGPSTADGILTTLNPAGGVPVQVACQVRGGGYTDPTGTPSFPGGAVWDKLSSGGYIADGYINTPSASSNQFSAPIWQCQ